MKPAKKELGASAAAEKVKKLLIIKGRSSSQVINDVMKDLSMLSKPHCKALSKKNDVIPFENHESLEFLSQKNDCSMFAFGSHTKKRPHNLVLGRLFDGHIMDMVEFGIDALQKMTDFPGEKKGIASKPVLIFQGDQWENDSMYKSIQNLLLDVFRGYKASKISMKGVDHTISCTCVDGRIFIRAYNIAYQKSDSKLPTVVLHPMGPFMDLSVRRSQLPSDDLWKVACKKDKTSQPNKVKNIKKNSMGDKVGRIHMKKQNLDTMAVRRVDALRNRKKKKRSMDSLEDTSSSTKKKMKV